MITRKKIVLADRIDGKMFRRASYIDGISPAETKCIWAECNFLA